MMIINKGAMKPLGIYIHIPFCVRKCPYCDFYSVEGKEQSLKARYLEFLKKEITYYGDVMGKGSRKEKGTIVDTLFFGGGTPSLLEPRELKNILESLDAHFHLHQDVEITMECNPSTVNLEKLRAYRTLGVNRLSVGVQSLDSNVLKALGRIHDREKALETIDMARKAGFENFSVDLIFAIENQTLESWTTTVGQILKKEPTHISLYSLEFMEGTEFWEKLKNGEMVETSEDADREMYEVALEMMKEKGYHQYEISNIAKSENWQCRHNLKYWSLDNYLGLGPSAHSYVDGVRFFNEESIDDYMRAVEEKGHSRKGQRENTREDDISEYVFTGLRKSTGIDFEEFEKRFGEKFWKFYGDGCHEKFKTFTLGDFAKEDEGHIWLTSRGMSISNKIMCLFV